MSELSQEINLVGLKCPLPIVELNRLIKKLSSGEAFRAIADDPAFLLDVEAWCKRTGHTLIEVCQRDSQISAVIRKTA
jgi:tRNA 2-thiouridine synthesizing protein A